MLRSVDYIPKEVGNPEIINKQEFLSSVGFPGGTVVKNLPANAGDTGLSPGPRRSHMLWSN